jgi:iron complex outermembrane receptor protein
MYCPNVLVVRHLKKRTLQNLVLHSVSLLWAAGYLSPTQAQIAPPPDYDQKLSGVTVNATRSDTPLDQIPLNTTILTKEVLELAPDQTIDQILKNQPGVFLNDQPYYEKDPTGQSLNVRGLGNARTLVLADGSPLNDAFYGTIMWNLVPLSSIDTVEFMRGGISSLWGNWGMGGVINMNTRTPKNSQQEVSANYGTFNTVNLAASKDIMATDNLQLRLSADYLNTGGYTNIATISPAAANSVKPGMGSAAAQNTNVRLQSYFKAGSDTKGFVRLGYGTMADYSNAMSIATNLKQTTDLAAGTTTKLSESDKVLVNLFYQNTAFNKQNGSNAAVSSVFNAQKLATNTPYISSNYYDPYSTTGAGVQYIKDMKGLVDQVLVGVDGRNISGSNLTNNLTTTGAVSSVNYAQGQQNFYGVMGQAKSTTSIIPLQTTLALRVDNWSSSTPTYYNTGPGGKNASYQNISNQNKTILSPNLGFLYGLSKEWSLRSAIYQAYHAPGLNNTLRSYASSSGGNNFANPNLTVEIMKGFEAGTDYRWKEGFLQLTAFTNQVTNAITTYNLKANNATDVALAQKLCGSTKSSNPLKAAAGNCVSTSINYYTNNQNLQSQGIEMQFHHNLSPQWAVDAGYSLTNTVLTASSTSDPTGSQVAGVPQNIGNLGMTWFPVPKASITTTMRYVGNSWMDTAHTLPVPAYAIFGLRANYEVNQSITLYVTAVNMLNRQYITFGSGSNNNSYVLGMPQAFTVGGKFTF